MRVEHASLHGLLFGALQAAVALCLGALLAWHHLARGAGRRAHLLFALLFVLFAAWYVLLRVQPMRRGAAPFSYPLGLFDGVSLMGALLLIFVHALGVALAARTTGFRQGKTI